MKRKSPFLLAAVFTFLFLTAPSLACAENALAAGVKFLTTRAGLPYKLIPPAVVSSGMADISLQKIAAVQLANPTISADQLQRSITQAILTPPQLNLTSGLRNGQTTYTLTRDELQRYIDYALPLAPITQIYPQVRLLQQSVDNTDNFFLPLVKSYYYRNFAMGTPHVRALLAHVAQQNNPEFEARFLERLEFLTQVKDQVAAAFSKKFDSTQIRIRYIHDLDFLTAENFKPEDLLISVEQKMSPSLKRNFFSHITGETKLKINRIPYRIFNFKGPLEKIDELYKFLVNGYTRATQMHLTIDHPRRAIFLYNADKSIWLRVTPHEYSYVKKLHVHMHTALPFTFQIGEQFVQDRVLLNLSIPIATPKRLPENDREQFLQDLFVGNPAQKLRALPDMDVIEKF